MVAQNVLGVSTSQGHPTLKKGHMLSSSLTSPSSGMHDPTSGHNKLEKNGTNSYGPIGKREQHQRGYSHNSALISHLENKNNASGKPDNKADTVRASPALALNIASQVRQSHMGTLA